MTHHWQDTQDTPRHWNSSRATTTGPGSVRMCAVMCGGAMCVDTPSRDMCFSMHRCNHMQFQKVPGIQYLSTSSDRYLHQMALTPSASRWTSSPNRCMQFQPIPCSLPKEWPKYSKTRCSGSTECLARLSMIEDPSSSQSS